MKNKLIIFLIFILLPIKVFAIDLNIIAKIESNNNPFAYNVRTQATGLYQITPICLKDYNNFHKKKYLKIHLFNPFINKKIAIWYFKKRIPQMLRYFKKSVTDDNILISYNAGIKYVAKNLGLPEETKKYLQKYKQLISKSLKVKGLHR